jgi:ribonuclease E
MKKEMLINVLQPEECRIAIVEDGVLEELYVERTSHESYVGNIYKGRIVNIEPSIQAAFVDFGVGRNGFLHVSDVEPTYYRHLDSGRRDIGGRRGDRGGRSGRPRSRQVARPDPFPPEEPLVGESFAEELPTEGKFPPDLEEAADISPPQDDSPMPSEDESGLNKDLEAHSFSFSGEDAEEGPEPAPESEHEEPPAPDDSPRPDDRPRYMDSAERHTEEGNPSPEPTDVSPDDADIFFPRPSSSSADHEEQAAPAPSGTEMSATDLGQPEESPPVSPVTDTAELREEPAENDWAREEIRADDFGAEAEDYAPRPRRRSHHRDDRRGDDRRGDDRRGGGRGRRPSGGRSGFGRPGFGRPGFGRPKPLIQDIFRRGQEVLVQVIKEGIGTKGPTLSTYISIAGRYLVLMPGLNRIGVSRKIADEEQRRRLREILHELQPPKGLGFIIRTAGLDRTKKELQRDLAYLSRLWQVVVRRIKKLKSPAEIYQESDMITRTIRDTFTSEIDTIWVDEPAAFEHAQEFLQIVMPRYASRIKHYEGTEPLFHKYGIENEISRIQQRHVPLPNGGSIVIDQTEALVAIDVNSGNFRADNNAEETAYQMNLQAAKEIARQLRLRDLGGVIVNDFIDMREEKHRRGVEKAMRDAVKRDRARTKILKISPFGIIEMTRQRIRPSLKRSVYHDCPHCEGTGQVKTCESMSIDVMRMLQLAAHRENIQRIQVRVAEDVAHYLLNKKRKEISQLEEPGRIQITVTGAAGLAPETLEFTCFDNNNSEVKFLPQEESRPRRR